MTRDPRLLLEKRAFVQRWPSLLFPLISASFPMVVAISFFSLFTPTTWGAELTRVATAFEKNNPYDINLSIGYSRTQHLGTILRERHQEGHVADVVVLRYSSITDEMPVRIAVGVFHDLELHLSTSLLFRQVQDWDYSTRHTASIQDNVSTVDSQGNPVENAPAFFAIPGKSYHRGWSNLSLGVAWALFNQEKDETKPQWLVSLDYIIPTSSLNQPWISTSKENPGAVGDKAHRFVFSTAISKRMGVVDPYVKFSYSLPFSSSGSANNCDNPAFSQQATCTNSQDSRTGYKPPHSGGFLLGSELHSSASDFLVDFQLGAFYIGKARTYNELSDALGKLLQTEDYLHVGASAGIQVNITRYFQIHLDASLYHDTEHFLTNEPLLEDNGQSSFDYRYDTPGRRFRISEVSIFCVNLLATARF